MFAFAQIEAARNNDQAAAEEIFNEIDSRLYRLAWSLAKETYSTEAGMVNDLRDQLFQDARLIAWEIVLRYQGDTADGFVAYVYSYVRDELRQVLNLWLRGEEDTDGKKRFAAKVREIRAADVNHVFGERDYIAMAEQAVQDKAMGGHKLSPERAEAARLSYVKAISIYEDNGHSDSYDGDTCVADTLASDRAVEDQADIDLGGIRPFQWTVPARAVEANLPLPKDSTTRDAVLVAVDRFRAGNILEEDLDLLESLPCRSEALGTAVDMLRSLFHQRQEAPAASQALKQRAAALGRGSVALNAQQAVTAQTSEAIVRRALVRRVLAMLSPRQAYILAATFAFEGMGKFPSDKAIAAEMNRSGFEAMDATKVYKARDKARAAFARRWADVVSTSNDMHAALFKAAEAQGVDMFDGLLDD